MRSGKWGVNFDAEELAQAGQSIKRLGGYDQALRLERELADFQRRGITVRMTRDEDGRLNLVPVTDLRSPDAADHSD